MNCLFVNEGDFHFCGNLLNPREKTQEWFPVDYTDRRFKIVSLIR